MSELHEGYEGDLRVAAEAGGGADHELPGKGLVQHAAEPPCDVLGRDSKG
ncbi:hypothetical protein [Streptomyces sp. NPDC005533]